MAHQMPITIPRIVDLAIGAIRTNIMEGIPQRIIREPSRIQVAATREDADVTIEMTIGSTIAIPAGSPVNILATAGTLPRFDQDGLGIFAGDSGDEIAIFASNINAALREIRVQVRILAIDDLPLAMGAE